MIKSLFCVEREKVQNWQEFLPLQGLVVGNLIGITLDVNVKEILETVERQGANARGKGVHEEDNLSAIRAGQRLGVQLVDFLDYSGHRFL